MSECRAIYKCRLCGEEIEDGQMELNMGKSKRKPRPQSAKWYWRANDGCYGCKNRNNCNQCKPLKAQKVYEREKRERRSKYEHN